MSSKISKFKGYSKSLFEDSNEVEQGADGKVKKTDSKKNEEGYNQSTPKSSLKNGKNVDSDANDVSDEIDYEDIEVDASTPKKKKKKEVYQSDVQGSGEYDDFRKGEQGRDKRLSYSYKVLGSDGGTNFEVPKYLRQKEEEDDSEKKAGDVFEKYGRKRVQKYLTKAGYKTLAKQSAKQAGKKIVKKTATKGLAKAGAKMGGKSLSKKLPFGLGLIPAAWFAGERVLNRDFSGAGLELASGASAALPWFGTAGSFGIDAYLLNRDLQRETGTGVLGHGAKFATKAASKYMAGKMRGESCNSLMTLYKRAKIIFESVLGIDESCGGYCFDDYVYECNIDNSNISKKRIDESNLYFGYGMIFESSSRESELNALFRVISPDGKVSIDDIEDKPSDSEEITKAKRKIREILYGNGGGGRGRSGRDFSEPSDYYGFNKKDYKKSLEGSTDSSGDLTISQKLHKGFDQLGDAVTKNLSRYGIPSSVSKKLHIPRNLFKLAGTTLGGMLFGPLGAIGGAALTNYLSNRHQDYKAKQYARLHGLDDETAKGERSGYAGKLIGAGIGSALGPAGALVGTGIGHLLDRKTSASIKRKTN